jgi:hypothetical protein
MNGDEPRTAALPGETENNLGRQEGKPGDLGATETPPSTSPVAVTPNRLLKEALERAVEKCQQCQDAAQQPKPLILLDASECLEPDFDWMNILERPL